MQLSVAKMLSAEMVADAESVLGCCIGTNAGTHEICRRTGKNFDRVDVEPGDDVLGTQLYFIWAMLFEENIMEKVETVQYGEGLHVWRLLVTDFEPNLPEERWCSNDAFSISRLVHVSSSKGN